MALRRLRASLLGLEKYPISIVYFVTASTVLTFLMAVDLKCSAACVP